VAGAKKLSHLNPQTSEFTIPLKKNAEMRSAKLKKAMAKAAKAKANRARR
jgi:hypothetical protein